MQSEVFMLKQQMRMLENAMAEFKQYVLTQNTHVLEEVRAKDHEAIKKYALAHISKSTQVDVTLDSDKLAQQ